MKCPKCSGTGIDVWYDPLNDDILTIECSECNGTGEIADVEKE